MSEEKKEESCSTAKGKGCNCCSGVKLLIGLAIGVLIFVAGMCFAKSHCCHMGGSNYCPFSSGPVTK